MIRKPLWGDCSKMQAPGSGHLGVGPRNLHFTPHPHPRSWDKLSLAHAGDRSPWLGCWGQGQASRVACYGPWSHHSPTTLLVLGGPDTWAPRSGRTISSVFTAVVGAMPASCQESQKAPGRQQRPGQQGRARWAGQGPDQQGRARWAGSRARRAEQGPGGQAAGPGGQGRGQAGTPADAHRGVRWQLGAPGSRAASPQVCVWPRLFLISP